MHTEIVRCLRIRHASLFDQPHRLKLELACKLPPFHDSPPVPSKHLTRCQPNRVQANSSYVLLGRSFYYYLAKRVGVSGNTKRRSKRLSMSDSFVSDHLSVQCIKGL